MPENLTVRASSWGKLFDCGYAWEGTHLLGIRKPAGMRALLGTSLHRSTAAFDRGRMDQSGVTADDAADLLVETIHHPNFDVDRNADDLTPRDAEKIGLSLHTRYCHDVSPRYTFHAVELTTEPFTIDCGNGVSVTLTGSLDRSRLVAGDASDRISDLKSGASAVQKGAANTKGHFAQVGTYQLLYEHTTGRAVDDTAEIIGLKTKGKPEIASGEIHGARARMTGTEQFPGLIEFAARMFATGDFYPNPSSILCHPKYCARWSRCPYKDE
ncbi:MAG: PD-(D/E)XK nuclease family protein [Proteobacteria bacterium]|nr:MAG: PD-(D/E)XK nuclease family protein [Pseudomonadota bacterium]